MRFLILGAGGIGGYFGGRLAEAGEDVTFLVRAKRAERLKRDGLAISSPAGDAHVKAPKVVTSNEVGAGYDVVLLTCKSYDLGSAMEAIAPAVGPDTAIVPLLNGMSHLDTLEKRFGGDRVLGGECVVSVAMDADGRIHHLSDFHQLVFGERDGRRSKRAVAIAEAFAKAKFDSRLSEEILQEMWEKWIFIATTAGITCLMRAALGDVVKAGGEDLATGLFDECCAISTANGHAPREVALQRRQTYQLTGSTLMASMLRDIERGAETEGDHILGDLLARGGERNAHPLLRIAHTHVKAYEARRAREAAN